MESYNTLELVLTSLFLLLLLLPLEKEPYTLSHTLESERRRKRRGNDEFDDVFTLNELIDYGEMKEEQRKRKRVERERRKRDPEERERIDRFEKEGK